jgi:lipopolysaccharide export system protein LptC
MPELAVPPRSARQIWAAPGSRHDIIVRIARVALPAMIGVLGAALIFAPLSMRGDISFVLDKNKVAMATERMRVTTATYRGEDGKGQPFELRAGSAVQTSSRDPVVKLRELTAAIILKDGPATLTADSGRYNMDRDVVMIDGPLRFATSDGYRLDTRDVAVGLKTRRLASGGPVTGQMPLGSFSANRISADLSERTVTLDGRARLHIVQGRAR